MARATSCERARTGAMLANLPGKAPRGLATVLRTTFVSFFLIVPALFLRVQGFFND